ncbi:MAG TPA: 4-alpha-glucanotransferase, partial [Nitrososphaerales archaeon]
MPRRKRSSGVLLHVTSLPSKFGVGDLGPQAYNFVDRLAESGQTYWQILPLTPTDVRSGNSPYDSNSSFAGNSLLVSPELLAKESMIDTDLVERLSHPNASRVNYRAAAALKQKLIE